MCLTASYDPPLQPSLLQVMDYSLLLGIHFCSRARLAAAEAAAAEGGSHSGAPAAHSADGGAGSRNHGSGGGGSGGGATSGSVQLPGVDSHGSDADDAGEDQVAGLGQRALLGRGGGGLLPSQTKRNELKRETWGRGQRAMWTMVRASGGWVDTRTAIQGAACRARMQSSCRAAPPQPPNLPITTTTYFVTLGHTTTATIATAATAHRVSPASGRNGLTPTSPGAHDRGRQGSVTGPGGGGPGGGEDPDGEHVRNFDLFSDRPGECGARAL